MTTPLTEEGLRVEREPGWYWIKFKGLSDPVIAYCHGSSWNGLIGVIPIEIIDGVIAHISPPGQLTELIAVARAYRDAKTDGTPRMWRGKALQDLVDALDSALAPFVEDK